jgi:hypothetical protein
VDSPYAWVRNKAENKTMVLAEVFLGKPDQRVDDCSPVPSRSQDCHPFVSDVGEVRIRMRFTVSWLTERFECEVVASSFHACVQDILITYANNQAYPMYILTYDDTASMKNDAASAFAVAAEIASTRRSQQHAKLLCTAFGFAVSVLALWGAYASFFRIERSATRSP